MSEQESRPLTEEDRKKAFIEEMESLDANERENLLREKTAEYAQMSEQLFQTSISFNRIKEAAKKGFGSVAGIGKNMWAARRKEGREERITKRIAGVAAGASEPSASETEDQRAGEKINQLEWARDQMIAVEHTVIRERLITELYENPALEGEELKQFIANKVIEYKLEQMDALLEKQIEASARDKLGDIVNKISNAWSNPKFRKARLWTGLGLTAVGVALAATGNIVAAKGLFAAKGTLVRGTRSLGGALLIERGWDKWAERHGEARELSSEEIGRLTPEETRKRIAGYQAEVIKGDPLSERTQQKQQTLEQLQKKLFGDILQNNLIRETRDKDYADYSSENVIDDMLSTRLCMAGNIFEQQQDLLSQIERRKITNRRYTIAKYALAITGGVLLYKLPEVVEWATGKTEGGTQALSEAGGAEGAPEEIPGKGAEEAVVNAEPAAGTESLTWQVGNLQESLEWNQDHSAVMFGGKEYEVVEGKISVLVDINHDGMAEENILAEVDVATGQGEWIDSNGVTHQGYAFNNAAGIIAGENKELVFRTHGMLDITGDGKVETAFWMDEQGGHLSHDLNAQGVEIDEKMYGEWSTEELKDMSVLDHKIRFDHFAIHEGVDLSSTEAVAKDLAHQMEVVNSDNYDIEDGVMRIDAEKLASAEADLTQKLTEQFKADPNWLGQVKESGLTLEKWQEFHTAEVAPEPATAPEIPTEEAPALYRGTESLETLTGGGFNKMSPSEAVTLKEYLLSADQALLSKASELKIDGFQTFVGAHSGIELYQGPEGELAVVDPSHPEHGGFKLGKILSNWLREQIKAPGSPK